MLTAEAQRTRSFAVVEQSEPIVVIDIGSQANTTSMRVAVILIALAASVSGLFAQGWTPWQATTPRQRLDVTGKGESVAFNQVDLPAGMVYRVHTEERVDVGDGGIADARYYVKIFPIAPPTIPVSLKMKYDVSSEDWFNSGVAPAEQSGYQSNHIYDALVRSRGAPLAFRFFDREDAPSPNGYYNDNNGSIIVEVSRETPGLAVKLDTLDFGTVAVGSSKTLLDSIQGFGKGYQLENVFLTGTGAPAFGVVSEQTVPFGLKESTNEFRFTFSPANSGPFIAYFHMISRTAWQGDTDRVIVLIGNGGRAQVAALTDTLDFGSIAPGTSKTLTETFENTGNVNATIQSIQMSPASEPFTTSGIPLAVNSSSQASVQVTFAPPAVGRYFARFDATLDNGSAITFYAKGAAGQGRPFFTRDTLFFDTVVIGLSQVLTTTFINKEDAPGTGGPLTATGSTNTNPEFGIIGNPGPFTKDANSGEVYTVTFAPSTPIPNYGLHSGVFTLYFTDQPPKSVYFFGYDHEPLEALLTIDTFYYVTAGKEATVRQYLKSDLSGTLTPAKQLSESIGYDPRYFELLGVEKGAIIAGSEWNLATTLTAGRADISISTATSRFGAGGEIVKLRFRAKPNAPVDAYTYLPQNADFGSPIEPLAQSQRGKITVADICKPVRLTTSPLGTFIEQNHPNPFNPVTRIKYSVGEEQDGEYVSLSVYDAAGRLIKILVNDYAKSGVYETAFDGADLPSGVYAYTFRCGDYSKTEKMILSK